MTGIEAVLSRINTIEASFQQSSQNTLPLGADPYNWSPTGTTAAAASTGATQSNAAVFNEALQLAGINTAAPGVQGIGGASATTLDPNEPAARPGSPTGADLVNEARKYKGVPYVWGGMTPAGLDCSGLVKLSLSNLGVDIKRTARQQGTEGKAIPSMDQAKPGDLLIFNNGTHVGIYVGDGKMVDSPRPGKVVTERAVYETPTSIRRVLPSQAPAPAAPVAASSTDLFAQAAGQRQALAALLGSAA